MRARQAGLTLGFGLGAFFEGILLHPIAGFFYLTIWAVTLAGVLLLWSALRGPGRLPSGRSFIGTFLVGWGVFNMVEALLRHDWLSDWLIFGSGLGFVLLGVLLARSRGHEHVIERRSGQDRRSGSMVR